MNRPKKSGSPGRRRMYMLICKMAAASGVSWELAKLAGSKHSFLAPVSVILCLQATLQQSFLFSYHRIAGTVIGVVFTAAIAACFQTNGWTLALLLLIGTWLTSLLLKGESVLHEAALSIVLVLALSQQSGYYPIDRIRDTLIGVGVAALVHIFIAPPNFIKEGQASLARLSAHLADRCTAAASWVNGGCRKDEAERLSGEVRAISDELKQTEKALGKAAKSFKFNPFAGKSKVRLSACREHIRHVEQGVAYLEKAVHTIRRWSASGTMTAADQQLWSAQLQSIGTYWAEGASGIKPAEGAEAAVWKRSGNGIGAGPFPLQAGLPAGMEPYRYPVSLYADTAGLLEQLQLQPRPRPGNE